MFFMWDSSWSLLFTVLMILFYSDSVPILFDQETITLISLVIQPLAIVDIVRRNTYSLRLVKICFFLVWSRDFRRYFLISLFSSSFVLYTNKINTSP